MMRKYILFFLAALVMTTGCVDKELENNIEDLENRVEQLEDLCKQMNADIDNLKKLIDSVEAYVVKIDPIIISDSVIGYVIVFSNGENITLKFGKDGHDGADGKDAAVPVIGVKKSFDGKYYWTVDGEFLLDADGEKLPASPENGEDGHDGQDAQDGQDGTDGKDGVTPRLKIEDGYWYISYDNGISWEKLDKATGEDGAPGLDNPGIFERVDVSDPDFVKFILKNGEEIIVPTWAVFEKLQTLCNEMNTNIESFNTILKALQEKDFVKNVTPLTEGDREIGYEITFSKSGVIRVYHGKDGTGVVEMQAPVIAIKQAEDGLYYWTLNGEWILNEAGEKMKAEGQDGQTGADGQDGVAPLLKIENNCWMISYDNGGEWVNLGKATGEAGAPGADAESLFQKVTVDDQNICFLLSDGSVLKVPYIHNTLVEKITALTFLPEYADGKVPMSVDAQHPSGIARFDFMVTPAAVIPELESSWAEMVSVKASYTLTRSIDFFDLPVVSFAADAENGVISVSVSGEHLDKMFFDGNVEAAVNLTLTDAFDALTSESVPMYAAIDESIANALVFRYRTLDNLPLTGAVISDRGFWSSVISNEYDEAANVGILKVPFSKSLKASAFKGISNLQFVEIDSRIDTLGMSAFEGCISLSAVILPDQMKQIDARVFKDCQQLSSINWPSALLQIGDFAFYSCAFSEVTIPSQMERIGANAFSNCQHLMKVFARPVTPPSIVSPFLNCHAEMKIYVESSLVDTYKSAWSAYAQRILPLE